jgi:putative ATP-dependent endonuclease of the OLD family
MKIQKLTIKNFRCLESVDELVFENLTVFVGRNGSGKSSILQAIKVLFTPNAEISAEDFFNRVTNNPIVIQAVFADFTEEEKKEFGAYIQKGRMIVTKRISWNKEGDAPEEEYFSYTTQIPEFAEIREKPGAREKTEALKELMASGILPDLAGKPRGVADTLEIMEKYEDKHPDLAKLTEAKLHFFGARNVGGGKLDKYTRFVHLPAVKEASEEIEGKDSAIEQLLNLLVLREMENRSDLVKFRERMTKTILKKFSPENLGGLEDISSRLTRRLSLYSPGSALVLRWNEIEPPDFDLPTVGCLLSEDGFEGTVRNKGHGLQRALILTLLEHLSTISAVEEIDTEENNDKQLRIDTILAIEEPEIYLHPTRSRYLANIFKKLTESSKSSTQVIYTTHSPYFVGMDRFNDIRVCRKKALTKTTACTSISRYDLESANKRLEDICGKNASIPNPQDNFRIRSIPTINTTVSEGFFSDLVVLVEGPTDAIVLWKVQEQLGSNWDQSSISLIPVDSKENIIKPKIVFDGLKIPNYIVFDKDEPKSKINKQLIRLLGLSGNELPPKKTNSKWAYNDPKLENELERMLTPENYEEIWKTVENELNCHDTWIRKKTEPLGRFIELVYEKGHSLPHYEEIVKQINALYKKIAH